jgi:hypothetical protein
MGFSTVEKEKMLALKGVGATVIARLEQIGFSSLSQLERVDSLVITKQISELMGSTRGAISAIVALAKTSGESA